MSEKYKEEKSPFRSLSILYRRYKEGTFGEIIDDWKWIFSYSKRYKGAIVFYTILGIISSSLTLISSVVSKYIIDIVTGYKTEKLGMLAALMAGSAFFSLVFKNALKRMQYFADLQVDVSSCMQEMKLSHELPHLWYWNLGIPQKEYIA